MNKLSNQTYYIEACSLFRNFLKYFYLMIIFLFLSINSANAILQEDTFINESLKEVNCTIPETNLNYNYESTESIPVKLQITDKISTKKNGVYDGKILQFKVREDVFYNNEIILKRGQIINAKVGTYLTRGMNGIPAAIIIDNFEIPGIDNRQVKGTYIKKGLNLTLFVLPLKWALTFLPPTGSFTNLIFGGNASISPKDRILIYYYPNWHS